MVKSDSLNFSESDYTLGGGQNALSILLQASYKFGKTGSNPHPQASYTLSCGQKELSEASHTLGGSQNGLCEHLLAIYMFGSGQNNGQNGLLDLLQASYTLGGGKRTIQTSTCHLHAWRWSKRILQTSTRTLYAWRRSKRSLRTSNNPPMHLAVVKMDFPYFC